MLFKFHKKHNFLLFNTIMSVVSFVHHRVADCWRKTQLHKRMKNTQLHPKIPKSKFQPIHTYPAHITIIIIVL